MAEQRRARVLEWIRALQAAGPDEDRAKAALNAVRDDPGALAPDRDHFYRTLAQQMLLQFLQAAQGKPFSPEEVDKLAKEAQQRRQAAQAAATGK